MSRHENQIGRLGASLAYLVAQNFVIDSLPPDDIMVVGSDFATEHLGPTMTNHHTPKVFLHSTKVEVSPLVPASQSWSLARVSTPSKSLQGQSFQRRGMKTPWPRAYEAQTCIVSPFQHFPITVDMKQHKQLTTKHGESAKCTEHVEVIDLRSVSSLTGSEYLRQVMG